MSEGNQARKRWREQHQREREAAKQANDQRATALRALAPRARALTHIVRQAVHRWVHTVEQAPTWPRMSDPDRAYLTQLRTRWRPFLVRLHLVEAQEPTWVWYISARLVRHDPIIEDDEGYRHGGPTRLHLPPILLVCAPDSPHAAAFDVGSPKRLDVPTHAPTHSARSAQLQGFGVGSGLYDAFFHGGTLPYYQCSLDAKALAMLLGKFQPTFYGAISQYPTR